jgi:hypothetical protein
LCVSVPSTELCLHCVMPLNIIICANAIAAIKLIVSTIGAQFCSWFRDEMDKKNWPACSFRNLPNSMTCNKLMSEKL